MQSSRNAVSRCFCRNATTFSELVIVPLMPKATRIDRPGAGCLAVRPLPVPVAGSGVPHRDRRRFGPSRRRDDARTMARQDVVTIGRCPPDAARQRAATQAIASLADRHARRGTEEWLDNDGERRARRGRGKSRRSLRADVFGHFVLHDDGLEVQCRLKLEQYSERADHHRPDLACRMAQTTLRYAERRLTPVQQSTR